MPSRQSVVCPILDSAVVVALSVAVFGTMAPLCGYHRFAPSVRWVMSVIVALALVVGGIGHSAHAAVSFPFQTLAVVAALDDGDTDSSTTDAALAITCHCACVPAVVPPHALAVALDARETVPAGSALQLYGILPSAEAPPPRVLT